MDIVTRIKSFLSLNGISSSTFADTCEIPRPTISQLLNGRNKKISNEVIDKIHAAYPALSIMWLMFGEEPMILENGKNANYSQSGTIDFDSASEGELHGDRVTEIDGHGGLSANIMETNIPIPDNSNRSKPGNVGGNSLSDALETIARNFGKQAGNQESVKSNSKTIVNIMVFYSDNSFESFVPNRQ